jgi:hypothetical protein
MRPPLTCMKTQPPCVRSTTVYKRKSYGTLIVTRRCAGLAVDMRPSGMRERLWHDDGVPCPLRPATARSNTCREANLCPQFAQLLQLATGEHIECRWPVEQNGLRQNRWEVRTSRTQLSKYLHMSVLGAGRTLAGQHDKPGAETRTERPRATTRREHKTHQFYGSYGPWTWTVNSWDYICWRRY